MQAADQAERDAAEALAAKEARIEALESELNDALSSRDAAEARAAAREA